MALMATCLQALGTYCSGELTAFHAGYIYVTAINLISVTVAMYALVLFYVVAQEELKPYNVVPKFLSIKFIIMMSFWQAVMVAGLMRVNVIQDTTLWTSENISVGVQSSLICVEMLIVAIWHLTAFKHTEFAAQGPEKTKLWPSLLISFNMLDVLVDIYNSFFTINFQFPNLRVLRKEDPSLVSSTTIELQQSPYLDPENPPPRPETETGTGTGTGEFAAIVL